MQESCLKFPCRVSKPSEPRRNLLRDTTARDIESLHIQRLTLQRARLVAGFSVARCRPDGVTTSAPGTGQRASPGQICKGFRHALKASLTRRLRAGFAGASKPFMGGADYLIRDGFTPWRQRPGLPLHPCPRVVPCASGISESVAHWTTCRGNVASGPSSRGQESPGRCRRIGRLRT